MQIAVAPPGLAAVTDQPHRVLSTQSRPCSNPSQDEDQRPCRLLPVGCFGNCPLYVAVGLPPRAACSPGHGWCRNIIDGRPTDTFPKLSGTSDWSVVRKTANWQHNGPVTDVSSSAIRCYQLSSGNGGATTANFRAGDTITWESAPNIFHPGALSAYMAKAPGNAADFDGSGQVWFKVYQDMPTTANGQWSWPSEGMLSPAFGARERLD